MFDFKFDWNEKMNTNIEMIDSQHKYFLSIGRDVEQLITTKCVGATDQQLLNIVCALRDFVGYHFYEEESIMQKEGYPDIEQHKKEHGELMGQLQSIDFHKLKEQPLKELVRLKEGMQDCIFHHMLVSDIQMARAIQSKQDTKEEKTAKKANREQFTLIAVVDGIDSAMEIAETGVDRIELCSNQIIGGTTPTMSLFKEIRQRYNGKIDVVIRPRSGDFNYSDSELKLMLAEIKAFKEAGADGIIIGALQPNGSLDYPKMQRMVLSAGRMRVILNRVIDVCSDSIQTMKEAGELGIKYVITSGQKNSCMDGSDLICEMMKTNDKMHVIVNCGTDGSVIKNMYEKTGATHYRISGMVEQESKMFHRNMEIHMGMENFNEYVILKPDKKRVTDAVEVIETI